MMTSRVQRPVRAGRIVFLAVLVAVVSVMPVASVSAAPGGIAVILGQWTQVIQQAADEAGVPWQVVAATMIVESEGNPDAVSASGAVGLMQLRPAQWDAYAGVYGSDPRDPYTNIRTGAAVLADAYATWGSWDLAVAAYVDAVDATGAVSSRVDDDGRTGVQYVDAVRSQAANLGYIIPGTTLPGAQGAEQALRIAMTTVGTPYVWGGESYEEGGFDCSGLVLWAYNQVGAALPRTAAEQFDATTRIDPRSVKPGDLIFFVNTYGVGVNDGARIITTEQRVVTHVGIYAGNGLMLHAPQEGDYVRLTTLNATFWRTHLAGYGRVE
jgi:cell wall-associated NlpC family hydrolase